MKPLPLSQSSYPRQAFRSSTGKALLRKPCERDVRPCKLAHTKAGPQRDGQIQPQMLFMISSPFNLVQVVKACKENAILAHRRSENLDIVKQFPEGCKQSGQLEGYTALFLDRSGSIHSLYKEDKVEVDDTLYWNHLALLAACKEGPLGILGLYWKRDAESQMWFQEQEEPSYFDPEILNVEQSGRALSYCRGWELDAIVVDAARRHMGLENLERSGKLVCHVGDALSHEASLDSGFAGAIVDLFAQGKIIEPLNQVNSWEDIRAKLKPGGRVIANVGKGQVALKAFCNAFSDADCYAKQCLGNWLAVSHGDPKHLSAKLPEALRYTAEGWRPAESTFLY